MIQTIGRAARNSEGKVIMYADKVTNSMEKAISETNRRRLIQSEYNRENNITPETIKKGIRDVIEATKVAEDDVRYGLGSEINMTSEDIKSTIIRLELEMMDAAEKLQFERAAELRDKISELNNML